MGLKLLIVSVVPYAELVGGVKIDPLPEKYARWTRLGGGDWTRMLGGLNCCNFGSTLRWGRIRTSI